MNTFIKGGGSIPKIIENLREEILATGRTLLFDKGYKALTIRAVAASCGIASGTVYNYFKSKDMLCALIMLEDWNKALEECSSQVSSAPSCISGLERIYTSISAFARTYGSVWSEAGTGSYSAEGYHRKLIISIANVVRPLLTGTGSLGNPDQSVFLSEILLNAAIRQGISFSSIEPFIKKLI